jgi:hypothetical protein
MLGLTYGHRMIIEAGYDVYQLLAPALLRTNRARDETHLLMLDENMRFHGLAKLSVNSTDAIADHAGDIRRELDVDRVLPTQYIVVGRLNTNFVCREEDHDWYPDSHLDQYTAGLRSSPLLNDVELLGHMYSNGTETCSDVPRYSFRDYLSLEHLPRAESFPGPHSFDGKCCPACARFFERLDANRARHESKTAALETQQSRPKAVD